MEKVLKWSSTLLFLFFCVLVVVIAQHPSMFVRRYGRRHRIVGAIHLVILIYGVGNCLEFEMFKYVPVVWYHLVLGMSGLILTLTAAFDFNSH